MIRLRIAALAAGFFVGAGLLMLGGWMSNAPPKQDPTPSPPLDGSVPVSSP
jgi:hypothetical protein